MHYEFIHIIESFDGKLKKKREKHMLYEILSNTLKGVGKLL